MAVIPGTVVSATVAPGSPDQRTAAGRFVRIELLGPEFLSLAEVEVYSNGINIARGKTATSSNLDNGPNSAPRAVDGNRDGVFSNQSVSHTNNTDRRPFWEVDLGSNQTIDRIEVYNRTDCCGFRLQNYTISVRTDNATKDIVWLKENNPQPNSSSDFASFVPLDAFTMGGFRAS